MLTKDPYYDIKAVSNSSLSYINPAEGGSPRKFKDFLDGKLKEDKARHFINGTLIHMAMLEPEKFVVSEIIKPSATMGDLTDAMLIQGLDLLDENILNIFNAFNYQPRWTDATKLKKFRESGAVEYINYMIDMRNAGKIGMDASTGQTVNACKTSFELNPTCNYLLTEIDEQKGIDTYNELEVLWTSKIMGEDIKCKAKLDRLMIDHKTKTYSILDVKTTGKTIGEFQNSFETFRYPRQINFYKVAANRFMTKAGYNDYTFDKAFIAAVETHGYYTSQLFDVTAYTLVKDQELADLMRRIAFHYNEFNWEVSMESLLNDGVIYLTPEGAKEVVH